MTEESTNLLSGRKALVTGASQGIGAASALALARAGVEVFATDRVMPENRPTSQAGITTLIVDVAEDESVRNAFAETGPVDILFNCAGIVHNGTILDCPSDDWDRQFDVNVKGCYRMIQAYLPGMLAKGGGCIINMASVASSVKGVPMRCAYGASKAAVIGLTKSIAADFTSHNIRCNAICPGTVDSPSLEQRLRSSPQGYDNAREAFIARQPMGRIGIWSFICVVPSIRPEPSISLTAVGPHSEIYSIS